MATYKFKLPVSETEIRKLKVNDILYLSGTVVTARDQAHKRALDWAKEGKLLPVNLEGLAVFHCGPVMNKQGEKWVAVAAGPTTSTRMDLFEDKFIEAFKPRIIVGKGGMGKRTADAMAKFGAVYCAFTGGAAVLAAKSIKRVAGVEWLDLGMPEAMWILEVELFGPLVVAIDSNGNNLFADVAQKVEANKQEIYRKLCLQP
jgi:fumarate hydratase subunit beta